MIQIEFDDKNIFTVQTLILHKIAASHAFHVGTTESKKQYFLNLNIKSPTYMVILPHPQIIKITSYQQLKDDNF